MIYDNRLIKEINSELAERRKAAESRAEYYADILTKNADYTAAEKNYNTAKFNLSKARFNGDDTAERKAASDMKAASETMKAIRKKLGVTDEMLIPDYHCKICNDTGITRSGKRCRCFEKLACEITLEELGIAKKPLPLLSESAIKENNLDRYYAKFSGYCKKFGEIRKNVVISGSVGTGKSHLAACIANELIANNYNVVFVSACELDTIFIKYHTAPVYDKAFYLSLLCGCDLLVIDDLGAEPIFKNVTLEYLLLILSERLTKNMPYIITTNLSQEQLLDRYGDRILSRLNDKKHGVNIEIKGEDLRRKK
ncbi:MAG: ATP-binding protein [Clostridiales bacterium]|nr:ATP-binding protein [Clostridiales bacterium]MDY2901055.1 ATP-binding protein [Christensenellaceae bacterium]